MQETNILTPVTSVANTAKRRLLPWRNNLLNEPFYLKLLEVVIINNAHTAIGKSATSAWDEVHRDFWRQSIVAPYDKTSVQNLRNIYNSYIKDNGHKFRQGANTSGNGEDPDVGEGELSQLDMQLKQIMSDVECAETEATEKKRKAEELSENLQANENNVVLNALSNNARAMRTSLGTQSKEPRINISTSSFDQRLLEILTPQSSSISLPPDTEIKLQEKYKAKHATDIVSANGIQALKDITFEVAINLLIVEYFQSAYREIS